MRRPIVLAPLGLALVFPGPTLAAGAGGTVAPVPARVRGFAITPRSVAPGAALTIAFRIDSMRRRVCVRLDLRPAGAGGPATRVPLGMQPARRAVMVAWTPGALPTGRYSARLVVTGHVARASAVSAVEIVAQPPPAVPRVFPVQGPYSFGGPEARFGAARSGHAHQGQDIFAAEGTPVVAPVGGSIYWSAYQAAAAGYYLVLRGADRRDYAFMHLQEGSVAVRKDQPVTAGERLAAVGRTGDADGPHLHLEIWPNGWWASDASQPIDPLADLQAWAATPPPASSP